MYVCQPQLLPDLQNYVYMCMYVCQLKSLPDPPLEWLLPLRWVLVHASKVVMHVQVRVCTYALYVYACAHTHLHAPSVWFMALDAFDID